MSRTSEDALRKIKKCLALAKDKNADPNMASAALRQAQALMAEHRITDQDVDLSDVAQVDCTPPTMSRSNWEVRLSSMVARAFACDVVWISGSRVIGYRVARYRKVAFIGVGNTPTVAGYAWDVLARQLAKARLAHIRKQPRSCKQVTLTARGDTFAIGWLEGVQDKLQAFAGPEREQLLIEQYVAATFPNVGASAGRDRMKGRNITYNDLREGALASRDAQLNHGVRASTNALIGMEGR